MLDSGAAQILGRLGGSAKSAAKTAAARRNALGHGRPRKLKPCTACSRLTQGREGRKARCEEHGGTRLEFKPFHKWPVVVGTHRELARKEGDFWRSKSFEER